MYVRIGEVWGGLTGSKSKLINHLSMCLCQMIWQVSVIAITVKKGFLILLFFYWCKAVTAADPYNEKHKQFSVKLHFSHDLSHESHDLSHDLCYLSHDWSNVRDH